jgi:hypothetical protein
VDEAHLELGSGWPGRPLSNGHSVSAGGSALMPGEDGFGLVPDEPVDEVDWETTRYLAAATQLDLGYARRVVRQIIGEPFRAVAPAAGADVVVVTRWALAAQRRRAQRDGVLAFLLIFGVAAALLAWTWVALAVMVALAVVVVAYERWVRDEKVITRLMLRGRFRARDAPSSPSPRIEDRLAVVKEQQNGNLVVFPGRSAFVGSGRRVVHNRIVINTAIGKRGKDGKKKRPVQFSNPELHAALEMALKDMGFPDLRVRERLFVNGKHVAGDPRLLPDELGPPASSAPSALLYSGCIHPTPDARTYLCAEIGGWKGQLVVSLFARALQTRGSLQVEWKFQVLPPLHQNFLDLDQWYGRPKTRQFVKAMFSGVAWSVPALVWSPVQLGRYLVIPLADQARKRNQSYVIRNGYVFNYGSRRSIREAATGYTRSHYFLAQDELTFILLAQQTMLHALGQFLRKHRIDMTQFEDQEKTFISSVSNYNINEVKADNVAVGANSSASGSGKSKPSGPGK